MNNRSNFRQETCRKKRAPRLCFIPGFPGFKNRWGLFKSRIPVLK